MSKKHGSAVRTNESVHVFNRGTRLWNERWAREYDRFMKRYPRRKRRGKLLGKSAGVEP